MAAVDRMTSKEYWQKRETEHAKKNKMAEQAYAEEIRLSGFHFGFNGSCRIGYSVS